MVIPIESLCFKGVDQPVMAVMHQGHLFGFVTKKRVQKATESNLTSPAHLCAKRKKYFKFPGKTHIKLPVLTISKEFPSLSPPYPLKFSVSCWFPMFPPKCLLQYRTQDSIDTFLPPFRRPEPMSSPSLRS
jgi:hypothetical protein